MNISPATVSIPAVVPSVNPPTEQVARENRVREKILPTKALTHSAAEKPVSQEEKQLRNPSWDPTEHPDYHDLARYTGGDYAGEDLAGQLKSLLSVERYAPKDENGYSMKIKLPKEILDKIDELKKFDRTRAVVAMRYNQSVIANHPSEVLIVI